MPMPCPVALCAAHPVALALAVLALFALFRLRPRADSSARAVQPPLLADELAANGLEPDYGSDAHVAAALGADVGGALYLDLLKRVLLNVVYHESSQQAVLARSPTDGRPDPVRAGAAFDLRARVRGEDVSLNTLTMIGLRRLENLEAAIDTILRERVDGDLLETGCAKGGACIFMRAVLAARTAAFGAKTHRRVFCADTFSEQPRPHPAAYYLLMPLRLLIVGLTYLPFPGWQRKMFAALFRMQSSFPSDTANASEDTVRSRSPSLRLPTCVLTYLPSYRFHHASQPCRCARSSSSSAMARTSAPSPPRASARRSSTCGRTSHASASSTTRRNLGALLRAISAS